MNFASQLLTWFSVQGRKDLPWQQDINPYRVWISEIMLQQTQVRTVIPYYHRFMARFPDVFALAAAPIEEVLTLWAGLGYYARARHLHQAAQMIVNEFHGTFPMDVKSVTRLPGIGQSTAHAILSICFGQKLPILDGNVKRVIARFYGINEYPGLPATEKQMWALAAQLLPDEANMPAYAQAIMDLGAMICTSKNPSCLLCPVQQKCYALKYQQTQILPIAKPKRAYPIKTEVCLILLDASRCKILLETRAHKGIWGGLLTPLFFKDEKTLKAWCKKLKIDKNQFNKMNVRTHKFTHFQLNFNPYVLHIDFENLELPLLRAYDLNGLQELALPTPIKLLLQELI